MILDTLNTEQREAVVYPNGPLLVLSGAGTGKTRVLTARFAYLVEKKGINPQTIMAVRTATMPWPWPRKTKETNAKLRKAIQNKLDNLIISYFSLFFFCFLAHGRPSYSALQLFSGKSAA